MAQAADRVLRVVPPSDLTVVDPMFGTAWISLISGEMIWDSLFAWDSRLEPKLDGGVLGGLAGAFPRSNVDGLLQSPVLLCWNVDKK